MNAMKQNGKSGDASADLTQRLQRRLTEAFDELWDTFVDPRDALYDNDGQRWLSVGGSGLDGTSGRLSTFTTEDLAEIRYQCRVLALTNEFAINGHENRISYIVGSGHTYRAAARKGCRVDEALCGAVQGVLDEFVRVNHWQHRQAECVRRRDRDGEVFLRLFPHADGVLRVRLVEPGQVRTPDEHRNNPCAEHGVLCLDGDVETVHGYFVDGELVEARWMQHRKANVDDNVKRGLPLYFPVLKNLRRAEKLLRNMSVLAEIQSAIALIRKHHGAPRGSVQQFVADQADLTVTDAGTGRANHWRRYGPGTVLDAHGDVDYDFPAARLDASNYVHILQAELRAVASRLVMPEFMLTSDASNANYASTMVAEGPAVKMFERLQAEQIADDREVLRRAVEHAVEIGRLPLEASSEVEIEASGPALAVRDKLQEERVAEIQFRHGLLSPQTWSRLRGLDYDQEQQNLGAHARRKNTPT